MGLQFDQVPFSSVTAAMVFSKLLNAYLDPFVPDAVEQEASSRASVTAPAKQKAKKVAAAQLDKNGHGASKRGVFSWESRLIVLLPLIGALIMFVYHCTFVTSTAYSSPSVVLASRNQDGSQHIIDDFREAYYWLRQNTKEDAVVMSWWDYGYQIAGMADRPTLVDNNTWNNSAFPYTFPSKYRADLCSRSQLTSPLLARPCQAMRLCLTRFSGNMTSTTFWSSSEVCLVTAGELVKLGSLCGIPPDDISTPVTTSTSSCGWSELLKVSGRTRCKSPSTLPSVASTRWTLKREFSESPMRGRVRGS
jgi:hypothetical protein